MFLVILMYIIFASTFTTGKIALLYAQPIFLTAIRMFIGGALLLVFIFFFRRKNFKIKKKHIPWFVLIAYFHIYLPYLTEFWSLQYLTAAKTCLLYSLSPFVSAIFSYFYFAEKITWRKVVGLTIGICGFIPVLAAASKGEKLHMAIWFLSWPEIVMFVSVVSSVFGWIIFRKLTKEYKYSALLINGIGMVGGGILAIATSFIIEYPKNIPLVSNWLELTKWITLLIITANIVSYNLYGHLLKKYTATFLAFCGFICPLAAAVFGWLCLGEAITIEFVFTLFFVSIGLYIFYQEDLRQGYIIK